MKMSKFALCTLAALTVSVSSQSFAEQDRQGGHRKGPPPEAIEACSDQQAGDSVSFVTPRGDTLNGTCKEMRGQLVAMPEGHRMRHEKGGRGGPGSNADYEEE